MNSYFEDISNHIHGGKETQLPAKLTGTTRHPKTRIQQLHLRTDLLGQMKLLLKQMSLQLRERELMEPQQEHKLVLRK
ncbi:hypothetical protein ATANTOWER_001780 [Ataeniobius toweri]|uniref:Uncharacterized protein n=1 Tax=Ataeniobius toweri TaxID=208326 RepID=A0ABU7BZD3_9TELE|nr:hypothetical protein [Ataeniobius toweri]